MWQYDPPRRPRWDPHYWLALSQHSAGIRACAPGWFRHTCHSLQLELLADLREALDHIVIETKPAIRAGLALFFMLR